MLLGAANFLASTRKCRCSVGHSEPEILDIMTFNTIINEGLKHKTRCTLFTAERLEWDFPLDRNVQRYGLLMGYFCSQLQLLPSSAIAITGPQCSAFGTSDLRLR